MKLVETAGKINFVLSHWICAEAYEPSDTGKAYEYVTIRMCESWIRAKKRRETLCK
jgi:hypothetical protein